MSKKELKGQINAVFYTKPIKNSSSALVKCVGHRQIGEKINDEPLMCNDNPEKDDVAEKYVFDLSENLYLRFYRALYTDKYLMTNKIIPVIYCSVVYHDKFWGGLLMNICIEFKIESEIKTEKQLIDNKIDGKYFIVIRITDEGVKADEKPKIIDIDEFLTEQMMIDTIKSLAETEEMQCVIKGLLEKRRLERVEKYGSYDDIEISKPKYNFKDLVNEYKKTGKLNLT
jgi:hypothetical protein